MFKVGDVVIAKTNRYSITRQGCIGIVIEVLLDGEMRVVQWSPKTGKAVSGELTDFPVDEQHFALYKTKPKHKHTLPAWW